MTLREQIEDKLRRGTLRCAVVGLGYVGLPLAVCLAAGGFSTLGVDVDAGRVEQVNGGSCSGGPEGLARQVRAGRLRAAADFSGLAGADFIALCVPTPLDGAGRPDLSCVEAAAERVGARLTPGALVVLESTVYPGATRELVCPILERASGLTRGRDFLLAFAPERVDPGSPVYTVENTPRVVGGMGEEDGRAAAAVYAAVLDAPVRTLSSPETAETAKLLENTYRCVNIALANEMAVLCRGLGVNVWEVVEAAATKPFGFQAFFPGPGPGGHCIPVDPVYLAWRAEGLGMEAGLVRKALEVNAAMPGYAARRAGALLERRGGLAGARVLVVGAAYKPGVSDCRESPGLRVLLALEGAGARTAFYDPLVPVLRDGERTRRSLDRLSTEVLAGFDLAVVAVAQTGVDYALLAGAGVPVLDCAGACPPGAGVEVL